MSNEEDLQPKWGVVGTMTSSAFCTQLHRFAAVRVRMALKHVVGFYGPLRGMLTMIVLDNALLIEPLYTRED